MSEETSNQELPSTDAQTQEQLEANKNAASESADSNIDRASAMKETQDIVANNIVKNHIIASIGLGLIPIPLIDLSALTATQMNMLRSLSVYYEVPFNDRDSKALITSLIGGSLPVLSVLGLSSFAKLIPGVGSLTGSASLSVMAGAVTYAVGQVFIMHFEEGGTFDDFDPKQSQAFFRREFESGKSFVRHIRDEVKAVRAAGASAD